MITNTIESRQLDLIKIAVESHIKSRDIYAHNQQLHQYTDQLIDQITYNFSAYVLGEKQKPIVIPIPLGFWRSAYKKLAPVWLQKKYPVVEETITIDYTVLYPRLKIKLPDNCGPVVVLYHRSDSNLI